MSEIAKCPVCGKLPIGVRWSLAQQQKLDPRKDNFNALACCGHMVRREQWNQYAAAMECLPRHNALVAAVMPVVRFWEAKSDGLTPNARANFWLCCGAGEKHCTAEDLDKLRDLVSKE